MKSPESTTHEGMAKLKGYTSLDTLYTSIFRAAFIENDDDDNSTVRSILSVVILATTPLSQSAIATLMGSSRNEVQCILELIQSLLVLPENPNHPVQPFHKSFPDFIKDPTRCTDKRFHISPDYHTKLALCCLKLIVKSLENTYPALDGAWNEASGSLEALRYARNSWHKHLSTKDRAMDAAGVLRFFQESAMAPSEGDGCGNPQESMRCADKFTPLIIRDLVFDYRVSANFKPFL